MSAAPITCKAVVAFGPKLPLQVVDIIVAPPRAGEVRLKVVASAVCHTDLYTLDGHDGEAVWPVVLGHEAAGIVESVGEGVTSVAVGDAVIPCYTAECRSCRFCTSGKTNLCSRVRSTQGRGLMPDGSTRLSLAADGAALHHYMGVSAFAEFAVCAEVSLAVVAKAARLDRVCLLGCGVTTGWGAVRRTARVEAGATAAVFGLGAVGLAAVMGLAQARASRIIAVDTNPAKEAAARAFGATDFVNPATDVPAGKSLQEHVAALVAVDGFGGVDYSFECVGSTALMRAALECTVRGWGKSVIIGVAPAGAEIATRPFQLVTGRVWTGTAFGGVKGRTELPGLVDEYLAGRFKLDEFVTAEFAGVDKVVDAVELMHDPAKAALRPVITYY
jgi:S-(hydroxymethyl)glutathione dehydrogenase/alcohol dehydrogenase